MKTFRFSEIAQKYTEYDMIKTHTELPAYPENRTRLLFAFLAKDSVHPEHNELYALAASLAQLGLDTHDLVESSESQEMIGQARSRQLKVLAGDYFNSRFYQLLSQAERVDVIQLVSGAICEVNRMKMNLYQRFKLLKLTAEEYIDLSVSIRTELFLAFSNYIPVRYAERWPKLLSWLTRCEVINDELERSHSHQTFRNSWAFWYILQSIPADDRDRVLHTDQTGFLSIMTKYNIHGMLADMLQSQIQLISRFIEKFDSDSIVLEISRMLQAYTTRVSFLKVAKEI